MPGLDDFRLNQPTSYSSYAPANTKLSYGGNLNYPDYGGGVGSGAVNEGLSGTSDVMDAASMIPGPQQPWIAGGNMAIKGIGTIAGIYGKYQDRQEAKKRYEASMIEYKRLQQVEAQDREREERRQERQEGYFASDFAQGLEDRFAGAYGGYRQPGRG